MSSIFPKILIISDVPVELSTAGATLLYRLFETYPEDKICIIQGTKVNKEKAIAGLTYYNNGNTLLDKLRTTRLRTAGSILEYLQCRKSNKQTNRIIRNFKPDCIVSVTFRFAWITAYYAAKRNNLPLHLILHDDILTGENHGRWLTGQLERDFRKAYIFATSRFCISPNMERYYKEKYGMAGIVIYPTYARDAIFSEMGFRNTTKGAGLNFCYAGSLYTPDFIPLLNSLAKILLKYNCKLYTFSNACIETMRSYEFLAKDHVIHSGLVHPNELQKFMNENVDVNIVLNSFDFEIPFKYNFSSKLVDYSLTGLPVLLWGPSSSGAISWALDNGYEFVLVDKNEKMLEECILKLLVPENRMKAARKMAAMGKQTFDFRMNFTKLMDSL